MFTGRNVFSELIALQGIEQLGSGSPWPWRSRTNRRAREEVAFASLLGGMSFGPTGTHFSHALQYPIGAMTQTPHGLGTGLLLPYVLDACRGDAARRRADSRPSARRSAPPAATPARARGRCYRRDRRASTGRSGCRLRWRTSESPDAAAAHRRARHESARLVAIAPVPATPNCFSTSSSTPMPGTLTERICLMNYLADLFIDGQWRAGGAGERFDVIDPADCR